MARRLTLLITAGLAFLAMAPAPVRAETPGSGWTSTRHADHPFVGTIWSTSRKSPVALTELISAIRKADITLIGEIHDNADHHQIQALLIDQSVSENWRPAITWEMIQQARQPVLDDWNKTHSPDVEALAKRLQWSKTGWPDWKIYRSIASVAARHRLPMFAGDPNRTEIRKLGRNGVDIFPADVRKKLALDAKLPANLQADLNRELKEGHCNMMPDSGLAMMSNVQRLRDGQLAESLLRARKASPTGHAVLIAGSGHTRSDRGVPWVLSELAPNLSVVSIASVEVDPKAETVSDLVARAPDGTPAADYVWVTPAKARPDPCEKLRETMERIRKQRERSGNKPGR